MTFTDFHSSGTVCSPTRAGIAETDNVAGDHPERATRRSEVLREWKRDVSADCPGVAFRAPERVDGGT